MSVSFRMAVRADVPAVVALLSDDTLGATREGADALESYFAAFDAMQAEGANHLVVGVGDGAVVASYQLTFINGLSLKATRRAQVESVRVAAPLRNAGIGALLMADAEARAREAGCGLIQLTTNRARSDAHRFYDRLGYEPSHLGYKKALG